VNNKESLIYSSKCASKGQQGSQVYYSTVDISNQTELSSTKVRIVYEIFKVFSWTEFW